MTLSAPFVLYSSSGVSDCLLSCRIEYLSLYFLRYGYSFKGPKCSKSHTEISFSDSSNVFLFPFSTFHSVIDRKSVLCFFLFLYLVNLNIDLIIYIMEYILDLFLLN